MANPFSASKGSTPAYDPRAIYALKAAQKSGQPVPSDDDEDDD